MLRGVFERAAGYSIVVPDTKGLRREAARYRATARGERAAAQRERRLANRGGDTAGTHLAAALVHEAAANWHSRLALLGDENVIREQARRSRSLASRLRRQAEPRVARTSRSA